MSTLFARATYRVVDSGHDLRSALAAGAGIESAADRLAVALESSLITLDGAVQGFSPPAADTPSAPETVEELLAGAVGQLWVADVAFSAGSAAGEDAEVPAGRPEALDAFDAALAGIDATGAALDAPADGARFGFEPDPQPVGEPAAAVTLVRERTTVTLATIAASTADVFTQTITALRDHGPEALRTAWSQLAEKLDLGGLGGRLARLGMRALEMALETLHRLVPLPALLALRDQIRVLSEAVNSDTPAVEMARWALAVDATAAAVEADLDAEGLQPGRLALAATSLTELADRCERLMRLAGGASVAVLGIGAVAGVFQLAVPHLPIVLAAAQLLVLGTALVLGRDFVDSRSGVGWVRGVRVIVRSAVDPT